MDQDDDRYERDYRRDRRIIRFGFLGMIIFCAAVPALAGDAKNAIGMFVIAVVVCGIGEGSLLLMDSLDSPKSIDRWHRRLEEQRRRLTPWHSWFAWRPVRVENGGYVWLKRIERQLHIAGGWGHWFSYRAA